MPLDIKIAADLAAPTAPPQDIRIRTPDSKAHNMNFNAALPLAALLLFVPGTILRAQDAKSPGESKPEKGQSLQGAWEGVEVGRETEGKCRLTVTGNAIDFKGATEK